MPMQRQGNEFDGNKMCPATPLAGCCIAMPDIHVRPCDRSRRATAIKRPARSMTRRAWWFLNCAYFTYTPPPPRPGTSLS